MPISILALSTPIGARSYPAHKPADSSVFALAALAELLGSGAVDDVGTTTDSRSPWRVRDGWRLNRTAIRKIGFNDVGGSTSVRAHARDTGFMLEVGGSMFLATGKLSRTGHLVAELDSQLIEAKIVSRDQRRYILTGGLCYCLDVDDPSTELEESVSVGLFTAPMPGRITVVHARVGQKAVSGQPLIALEAMKLEHVISAPTEGTVIEVNVVVGDQVTEGTELLVFEEGTGE